MKKYNLDGRILNNFHIRLTRYGLFAVQEPAKEAQQAGYDGGYCVGEGVNEGAQTQDGSVSPDHHPSLGAVTRDLEAGDHAGPGTAPDELTVNHSTENLKNLFRFQTIFSSKCSVFAVLSKPE